MFNNLTLNIHLSHTRKKYDFDIIFIFLVFSVTCSHVSGTLTDWIGRFWIIRSFRSSHLWRILQNNPGTHWPFYCLMQNKIIFVSYSMYHSLYHFISDYRRNIVASMGWAIAIWRNSCLWTKGRYQGQSSYSDHWNIRPRQGCYI